MTIGPTRLGAVFLCFWILTGCSANFQAAVTRFHVEPVFDGHPATVLPTTDVAKDPSFPMFAEMLGRELSLLGLSPAGSDAAAIEAILGYSWENQADPADNDAPSGTVGIGVGSGGGSSGVSVGANFPVGEGRTRRSYSWRVTLVLRNTANGKHVWEGRATSTGSTPALEPVMELMLRALLADFPGPSGVSTEVSVDPKSGETKVTSR